jgi:hypothetical protein
VTAREVARPSKPADLHPQGVRLAPRGRWMWAVVVVFALLHWDFWLWDDRTLWLGFLPAGLGYHALYSLGAGLLWAVFIRVAWPSHVEAWANEGTESGEGPR